MNRETMSLFFSGVFTPLLILGTASLGGMLLRNILFRELGRWAGQTKTSLDDTIVNALKGPFLFWCFLAGVWGATHASSLPKRIIFLGEKGIFALLVISASLTLSNVAAKGVEIYLKKPGMGLPFSSITQYAVRLIILGLGLLIFLDTLGIEIKSVIAALGIGSLAVALGLQDTLANFFSGVHLLVSQNIRIGDYIRIDSGEEGYVADIDWRTTKIHTLPNNVIFVPNAKLSQSIVTNYSLPEKRMSVLIPISVSYDCDIEKVEAILLDTAKKAASEVPGLLADPAPFVRFIPGFGDYALNFTLICQVKEFVDQYLVQHELRKWILKRFKEEGIVIPYPTRRVIHKEEPAEG